MPTDESGAGSDRPKWRLGRRVSRKDSGALGTIAEVPEQVVQIKWDGGATSFYRRDHLSDVLESQQQ
jgi:hypothetical protein